jgi:hypothetical protein
MIYVIALAWAGSGLLGAHIARPESWRGYASGALLGPLAIAVVVIVRMLDRDFDQSRHLAHEPLRNVTDPSGLRGGVVDHGTADTSKGAV